MASNNRTPKSVLTAPKVERIFIHEAKGPNRAQRRAHSGQHGGWTRNRVAYSKRVSFAEMYPTENEPYLHDVVVEKRGNRYVRLSRRMIRGLRRRNRKK